MFRVILVDDEKWIVEGLKTGVDWNKYKFQLVGDAANGKEALELVREHHPDVVITDIRMPEMNGLELIKHGKIISPGTLFVVLSGHADFAYAQKALNYGTFGYCLKPFEIEEIHLMLKRLAETLSVKQRSSKFLHTNDIYEALSTGSQEKLQSLLTTQGIRISAHSPIIPIVIQGLESLHVRQEIRHLHFQMSMRRCGVFVYASQLKDFITDLNDTNGSLPIGISIGIGPAATCVSELEASLDAASLASLGSFATGKPGVYSLAASADNGLNQLLNAITDAIKRRDRIEFVTCMDKARDYFRESKFQIKEAYVLFTSVMYLSNRNDVQSSGKYFEGYEQLCKHFGTANVMIDYLLEQSQEYFSTSGTDSISGISHKKIKDMLSYIHQNFTEELTIQGMSEQFSLSSNYLCHLFKKEVGENFVEYVSRLRMQYACKLLAETDSPIHLISEKCGFHDYFYFTRIFKRMNGMTPTQYREKATTL
ncbi:response regulator [Paenibacillus oryzisoli]|uniref:response regulator transcription factor n=1 Tax=Paenibacillus oryzisoli TaxID=1850517 RepID=UPI003D2AA1B6